MNTRLPTKDDSAYFWAEDSRELLLAIDILKDLEIKLKDSKYAFTIDGYYESIIRKCEKFLKKSGGSNIPENMEKIDLYYKIPIVTKKNNIVVKKEESVLYPIKLIGEGSYAKVFSYKDRFYNKKVVIKRALKTLEEKEVSRFKREYDVLERLNSPYVVEVYKYDGDKNEYYMEYLDFSLQKYVELNNSKLTMGKRKQIIYQTLRGFDYIHKKGILHRDISPSNILLKEYEDTIVVKLSDFGLVKIPDSKLTSINTEFKGSFNDPMLCTEGFDNYKIYHETYALTRLVYYILTGRTNVNNIDNSKLRDFVEKGLSPDYSIRYNSVKELKRALQFL